MLIICRSCASMQEWRKQQHEKLKEQICSCGGFYSRLDCLKEDCKSYVQFSKCKSEGFCLKKKGEIMKDRTVGQIVDEVMKSIPDEQKHHFDKVMNDLLYTAPEVINNWFNDKFLRKLNEIIPFPPVDDWHFEAVAALKRMPVEKVREQFSIKEE